MNETISHLRHSIIETRAGKTALALGLSASLLVACGDEHSPAPTEVPTSTPVEIEATPEQCAIFGLEDLSFNDDACVIEPAN